MSNRKSNRRTQPSKSWLIGQLNHFLDEVLLLNTFEVDSFTTLQKILQTIPRDGTEFSLVCTADIVFAQSLTIPGGARLVLCDDGQERRLTFQGAAHPEGMLTVAEGAALTITSSLQVGMGQGRLIFDGGKHQGLTAHAAERGLFLTVHGRLHLQDAVLQNLRTNNITAGAILVQGKQAELVMSGGQIVNNEILGYDGAPVILWGSGSFRMTGGEISHNEATACSYHTNWLSNTAGGVLLHSRFRLDRNRQPPQVREWQADLSFSLEGGLIHNNQGYFGGVGLHNEVPLGSWNTAYRNPPYTDSQMRLRVKGGEISGNQALALGGGIASVCRTEVRLEGGLISGNRAPLGGGVGISNLYHHYLHWNQEGTHSPTIQEWHKWFDCDFLMRGGLIRKNTAYHSELLEQYNRSQSRDQRNGCGGGLYLANSGARLIQGTIRHNQAELDGGGLYLANQHCAEIGPKFSVRKNQAGRAGNEIHGSDRLLKKRAFWDSLAEDNDFLPAEH